MDSISAASESLVLVVRLLAVEDALERLEVPDMRLLAAIWLGGAKFRDRFVDHVLRQDVQRALRPHRVNLYLCDALDVIEQVIGFRYRRRDSGDTMVRHHQHLLGP